MNFDKLLVDLCQYVKNGRISISEFKIALHELCEVYRKEKTYGNA